MLSAGRPGPGLCWDTAGRAFWLWWGTSSWGTLACLGFWGPHGPWGLCRWHNTLAELQDSRWAHCVSDHGKVLLAHSKPRPHKPRRRWEEGQLATGSPGASWWATTPKRSAHGVQHPGSRAHLSPHSPVTGRWCAPAAHHRTPAWPPPLGLAAEVSPGSLPHCPPEVHGGGSPGPYRTPALPPATPAHLPGFLCNLLPGLTLCTAPSELSLLLLVTNS